MSCSRTPLLPYNANYKSLHKLQGCLPLGPTSRHARRSTTSTWLAQHFLSAVTTSQQEDSSNNAGCSSRELRKQVNNTKKVLRSIQQQRWTQNMPQATDTSSVAEVGSCFRIRCIANQTQFKPGETSPWVCRHGQHRETSPRKALPFSSYDGGALKPPLLAPTLRSSE